MIHASYVFVLTAAIPALGLHAGDRVAVPSIDAISALFAGVADGKVHLVAAEPTLNLIKLGPDLGQRGPDPVPNGQPSVSAAA